MHFEKVANEKVHRLKLESAKNPVYKNYVKMLNALKCQEQEAFQGGKI